MSSMIVRVGTSGYQYKFWRGSFYPEGCKEADMLVEFGKRLPTVEVNNTFYRMPKAEVMQRWATQVPDDFRFAVKASRRITHIKRLKECGDDVRYLLGAASALGHKLGIVLFQLPPNLKCDLGRLDGLLAALDPAQRYTVEFRHESWFTDEVFDKLRAQNVALCLCDEGEGEKAVPWVPTATYGYLRLRRETYTDDELSEVAKKVTGESWTDAYAFFKHEPDAPQLAAKLQGLSATAIAKSGSG